MSLGIAMIQEEPIKIEIEIEREFNPPGIMQCYFDKLVPYVWQRWLFTLALLTIYMMRVLILGRFVFVTCFMGVLSILMFSATLRPIDYLKFDEQGEVDLEGMDAAMDELYSTNEAKPFTPDCSEPNFWNCMNFLICSSFGSTFADILDYPFSWFSAIMTWILVILMCRRTIFRMLKKKYSSFSLRKQGCTGKKPAQL